MLSRKLKSKKGFSLPAAIGITTVLIILSASLIAIAATSIVSTSSSVNQRQAYLNVRSAIEYAYAYYSDANYVSDLSLVSDEYMAMNDKEGGTVEKGASIVSQSEAEKARTYVIANYSPPDGAAQATLKLTAYSKASDAFGKKNKMVHLSATYVISNMSNKNRVTLTDIDMNTDVLTYTTSRDAINLHVKQYPGEEWTPFYYTWTYLDEANLYTLANKNCYSIDKLYKDQVVDGRCEDEIAKGSYNDDDAKYRYYKAENTKSSIGIVTAFNKNEDDSKNKLEPSSVWNVVKGNSSDPKNGSSAYFTPSSDGGGWYDATYYIKDGQVNYFNLILTTKGKVLYNTTSSKFDTEGVQTNEMFHLWFLNNRDRNIYFEFLKPGLVYSLGANWNGHSNSDDRYLVYVNNQKTAVHLKVKGIGNTDDEAYDPPTEAPKIIGVSVNGRGLFDDDGTYSQFSKSFSSSYYNVNNLETMFNNSFYGTADPKQFFYSTPTSTANEGQTKMIYEGCGWWVANIPTGDYFQMMLLVYDSANKVHNLTVNVTPSSNRDAYVVVDLSRMTIVSRLTEERAMDYIGEDMNSYVTFSVKTSEIGTPVSPYLDYHNMNTSLTSRRVLLEWINKGSEYVADDYEADSFTTLTNALNAGTELYNDIDYITKEVAKGRSIDDIDNDYKNASKAIEDAIKNLRTTICDTETYQILQLLLAESEAMLNEQETDYAYEPRAIQEFKSKDAYTVPFNAVKDNKILSDTANYSTTVVRNMITDLETAISEVKITKLDKEDLKKKITEANDYTDNSRFDPEPQNDLKVQITYAEDLMNGKTTELPVSIKSDLGFEDYEDLTDASTIQERINRQILVLDAYVRRVTGASLIDTLTTERISKDIADARNLLRKTPKENCTDDSYNNLSAALTAAEAIFKDANATQEDYDNAGTAIEQAIDAFTIYKPGTEDSSDVITKDKLAFEGKKRLWFKGFNYNTQYEGAEYTDYYAVTSGSTTTYNAATFKDVYTIFAYSIDEYSRSQEVGVISSASITEISSATENLAYYDIKSNEATGFKISLAVQRQQMYKQGDDWVNYGYASIITLANENIITLRDNNLFVIDAKDLIATTDQDTNGNDVINEDTHQVKRSYKLTTSLHRLSEVFVEAPVAPTVTIVDSDGDEQTVNTIKEGNYYTARFIYDADQKIKASYNQDGINYRYVQVSGSKVVDQFDTFSDQYVLKHDATAVDSTSTYFIIPEDSYYVTYANTTSVQFRVSPESGEEPKLYDAVYDSENHVYVAEIPSNSTGKMEVVRMHTTSGTEEEEDILIYFNKTDLIPGAEYRFTNGRSYDSSTGQYKSTISSLTISGNIDRTAEYLNVTQIYPKYSGTAKTSSSSSTKTSAALDGLVSTTIADSIVTVPMVSSELTQTYFDYFAQSGTNRMPSKNLGYTVIWIEKEVFESTKYLNYRVPYIYVWDKDGNDMNGAWPGRMATRVGETNYFYTVVPANSYGCILSVKEGSKYVKIGGSPQVNGDPDTAHRIFLDHVNVYRIRSYTNSEWYGSYYNKREYYQYGGCSLGADQGMCCLYERITTSVLDGTATYRISGLKSGYLCLDNIEVTHYTHDNTLAMVTEPPPERYIYSGESVFAKDTKYHFEYKYRALNQDTPVSYWYDSQPVDKSSMTKTDLKMAFVGGTKIRLTNNSYFNSFTTYYKLGHNKVQSGKLNSLHDVNLTRTEAYGGSQGNKSSMGRVGDTSLSIIYDWYERKIPIDASDEYLVQVRGLLYSDTYISKVGKSDRKWWDADYETDGTYTVQVGGLYGNVWMTLNNINDFGTGTDSDKFTNLTLYTQNPETVQIQDDQPIYFSAATGWKDIKVVAKGVGGSKEFTFTDTGDTDEYGNKIYGTTVPGNMPFLTFTATTPADKVFQAKTSLQGNDDILFNPNFNSGTGGWDSYTPPRTALERALYKLQTIYYGFVMVKQYDTDGTPKNLGDAGSYEFAEALTGVCNFTSESSSAYFNNGKVNKDKLNAMDINTVKSEYNRIQAYVSAYTQLYSKMALARAYIPGKNYPEYIHSGKPDIYTTASIQALSDAHDAARAVYISPSTTVDQILEQVKKVEKAIDNVTISTDSRIALIYYDVRGLAKSSATFEVEYKTKKDDEHSIQKKKVEYYNTEGYPIIFVEPAAGEDAIYDVHFIVNDSEIGENKDMIPLDDSAWVYMDITTKPYWVMNAAADYRDITIDSFTQGSTDATFTMNETRLSKKDPTAVEKDYRPITLYFRKNVTVKRSDGSSYQIMAGAYSFEVDDVNTTNSPFKANTKVISVDGQNKTVLAEAPYLDLYSTDAENFFKEPYRYYEYTVHDTSLTVADITTAEALGTTWVNTTGGSRTIVGGAHNTTKTVNMTVDSGSFAASRVWSYQTSGKFYFRWASNEDLHVDNNVTISASEITFASSGTINATNVYNKHLYFASKGGASKMEVIFPTDIHVEYYDKYRDLHSFTIREGAYTIEKATSSQQYIADLCDEEYWTSMEHVTVNSRYESEGQYQSSKSRLNNVVYSAD